jgi:excisionase family DNA binding protein
MITTQQAAQIIGCGKRHVNKLAAQGRLVAQRFGPMWMIDEASARAYAIDEQARKPGRVN